MIIHQSRRGRSSGNKQVFDLRAVVCSLARRRTIFHSEADFQHELAWEIRSFHPEARIRLEVPSGIEGIGTTDIVIRLEQCTIGIELKYMTKRLEHCHGDENYTLRNHGAQDIRSYDCIKDIQRIEKFRRKIGSSGFLVILTNDASYWRQGSGRETNAMHFRLYDGRTVEGELAWGPRTGIGTNRGRQETIILQGSYKLDWQNYSDFEVPSGQFRFLCIEAH